MKFLCLVSIVFLVSACGDVGEGTISMSAELRVHLAEFQLRNEQNSRPMILIPRDYYGNVSLKQGSGESAARLLEIQLQGHEGLPANLDRASLGTFNFDLPIKLGIRDFARGGATAMRVSARKNGSAYDLNGRRHQYSEKGESPVRAIEDCTIPMPAEHGNFARYEIELFSSRPSKKVRMVEYILETHHQVFTVDFTQGAEAETKTFATLRADRQTVTKHYSHASPCDFHLIFSLIGFKNGDAIERK